MVVETIWKDPRSKKDKIILWFALSNKLLTWDNGLKWGWIGPNSRPLCKLNEEYVSHLFVTYSYANNTWKIVAKTLKPKVQWMNNTLEQSLQLWYQDRTVSGYSAFPWLFTNGLWWARNNVIFQGTWIPREMAVTPILKRCQEFQVDPKPTKTRNPVMP